MILFIIWVCFSLLQKTFTCEPNLIRSRCPQWFRGHVTHQSLVQMHSNQRGSLRTRPVQYSLVFLCWRGNKKNKLTHFPSKTQRKSFREDHHHHNVLHHQPVSSSLPLQRPLLCGCQHLHVFASVRQKTIFKLKTAETGTKIRVRALQSVARNTPRVLTWFIIYDESTEEVNQGKTSASCLWMLFGVNVSNTSGKSTQEYKEMEILEYFTPQPVTCRQMKYRSTHKNCKSYKIKCIKHKNCFIFTFLKFH